MGGHQMTVEEVKSHLKGYYLVFFSLLFLTIVTVAISYLHLPIGLAILVALIVASVKGSLVALYFMHLISEKTVIYQVLALTGVLFIFVMLISFFGQK